MLVLLLCGGTSLEEIAVAPIKDCKNIFLELGFLKFEFQRLSLIFFWKQAALHPDQKILPSSLTCVHSCVLQHGVTDIVIRKQSPQMQIVPESNFETHDNDIIMYYHHMAWWYSDWCIIYTIRIYQ